MISQAVGTVAASSSNCTGECLKSGPWGLAIILLLGVACYFLFRSMSKHIKRVREQQQPPSDAAKVREAPAGQHAEENPADASHSDQ